MSRAPARPEAELPGQRIDKWLWFARLAKTRVAAQELVVAGRVRINRQKSLSASRLVRAGDVLTIGLAGGARVLRVLSDGVRRGSPAQARLLYEDLSAAPAQAVDDRGKDVFD